MRRVRRVREVPEVRQVPEVRPERPLIQPHGALALAGAEGPAPARRRLQRMARQRRAISRREAGAVRVAAEAGAVRWILWQPQRRRRPRQNSARRR